MENQEQRNIYELIVRHFLACCSKNAIGFQTKVTFIRSYIVIVETQVNNYILLGYHRYCGGRIHCFWYNIVFRYTIIFFIIDMIFSIILTGLMIMERNYLDIYKYEKWNANVIPDYVR